jgi:hypothetical protein
MPSPLALLPTPPEFHPEFGYIWPAAHNRRLMRIALTSTAAGALFGIIVALVMTSRADPDVAHTATALSVAPAPAQEPAIVGPAAVPMEPIRAAAAESPVVTKSCSEQTWPYLDSKCLNNEMRKPQPARILKPEAPAQSAPAQVVQPPEAEITTAAKAEAKPKAKKREKTSKRRGGRDREFAATDRGGRYVDSGNAYATPYPPRYEARGPAWSW